MTKTRAKLGSTGIFADAPAPAASPTPTGPRPPKAKRSLAEAAPSRTDRDGRKPMPFWTTEAAKKQLRILAAEQDTTQQQMMTDALNLLFKQYNKPPIA